jgi:protein required for attachment to host cells
MKRGCIAVVDAAHARLFTYDPQEEPALRDERDLVNPGRQAHEQFSTTKPGNRWQEGGRGSTDDHRDDQIAEHEQRFAKQVIGEVVNHVARQRLPTVILIASPKMMGALRAVADPLRKHGIVVHEIAQDLAWMTPAQLHDHLVEMELVGPRPRAPWPPGARA